MVPRRGFILIPAFLVAGSAIGQISFPGQYPGSQYPGGQYPGTQYPGTQYPGQSRGRGSTTTTSQNNQPTVITINGILRRISSSELVVAADDGRIVTLSLASSTRYYRASGGSAKSSDLQPGDHMNIDATQDDNGYYHAKNVTQVKQGTAQERAAAKEPVDASPIADASASDKSSTDDDADRPRLHRSSSSGGDDSAKAEIAPQQASPPSRDAAPDPDDPGPPKLRRGAAAAQARNNEQDTPPLVAQNDAPVAGSRPSIHADEVNGVTRTPDAPRIAKDDAPASGAGGEGSQRGYALPKSGDPIIDNAREAAFSFTETLPNYVVKQFTTRYQTEAAHGGQTSWRALDTVSVDVTSEGGKESYKNILVNGKPPKEAIEKTGTWSTGEYSSVLLDVLSPGTQADFHNKRTTTIANKAAYRYDFSVDRVNSHWHVYSSADSYNPEYGGAIWIDKENSRVLRIELSARNMPKAFPLDTVESAVDYDYVLIGDSKFLLPVHSEALSCERGTSYCTRNVIDFRNYKKFGADTSITFDSSPDK